MAVAFDSLLPASFNGTSFPVQKISVTGGLRNHVHEYPHQPGGSPEKLGRKLYVFKVSAVFANTFPKYLSPPLWPDRLRTLVGLFEAETTAYLTIPTVGTIKAFATDWDREMSWENLSGEATEITFLEDVSDVVDIDGLFTVATASLQSQAALLAKVPIIRNDDNGDARGLFDKIHDAVNSVLAIKDTADVYSAMLTSKIEAVVSLCNQADALLAMNDPANTQAIDALHDVWASALKLAQDVTETGSTIATYATPRLMSVAEISAAIFGDASHAVDILQMNPFEDALAVPKATLVKYFTA